MYMYLYIVYNSMCTFDELIVLVQLHVHVHVPRILKLGKGYECTEFIFCIHCVHTYYTLHVSHI